MILPLKTRPFVMPRQMPVMVLERCIQLPTGMQPLFIFEERYRLMLEHALQTDRMFAIGDPRRSGEIRPVMTAGVVVTSTRAPDGTSQLVLQGHQRVRITGWVQEEPFRIAQIETLETVQGPKEQLDELVAQLLDRLHLIRSNTGSGSLKRFRTLLTMNKTPEYVCDFVASMGISSVPMRRAVLEELDLPKRFQLLFKTLEAQ